jgi:hypothetical protein
MPCQSLTLVLYQLKSVSISIRYRRDSDPIFNRRLVLAGHTSGDKELKLDVYDVEVNDRDASYHNMKHDDWIGCCLFKLSDLCQPSSLSSSTSSIINGMISHGPRELPIHNPLQPG